MALETEATTILLGSGLQSWLDRMLINTKNISSNPIVIFNDLLCIHFPACGLPIKVWGSFSDPPELLHHIDHLSQSLSAEEHALFQKTKSQK